MTIWYPDLSHYDLDRGVTVQAGTVAVIAKSTHGTAFLDSGYARIKAQAAAVGAIFGAYHWLNHGQGAAQGRYCYAQVGRVPVMVDVEDMAGNTGYNGVNTVQDVVDFVGALRAAGGVASLVYLPHWYWQRMGSPSLAPLARLRLGLVSSNYTTYSDSGPGWTPYGGMTPVVWQYTSSQPYGGSHSDFNAYRGTVAQFAALLTGDDMATINQVDWDALIWRVEALVSNSVDLHGGPLKATEKNQLAQKVGALATDVAAVKAAVAALPKTQADAGAVAAALAANPAFLSAVGKAVADEMYRRMQA